MKKERKKIFVPIKGERVDPLDMKAMRLIQLPALASPKLDGIRAVIRGGKVLSYRLKPIPNLHIQKLFKAYEGLDGELTLRSYEKDRSFRKNTSAIMTQDGKPDVLFHAFDLHDLPDDVFRRRTRKLELLLKKDYKHEGLRYIEHVLIETLDDLVEYERWCLEQGYEGVIVRSIEGLYKYGRSTINEGYLLKLTRRKREEAEIVDYFERMKNNNVKTRDAHGKAKRSNHKANKVGRGDLGGFVVKSPKYKKVFEVGTGISDKLRKKYWDEREDMLGKTLTFEYSETGDYAVPRNPSFIGIRDRRDM